MTSDSVELGMYPAATGSASARLFTPLATAASCLAFVVIGALQALYGPAIPALRDKFGISPAAAGLSLSAHFVGALVGVLLMARLHRQWSNRRVLSASYALMAAGAAGFALAPTWSLSLVAALLLGLGFGGIDYGLNVLFAEGFGHRSTAMLNILNAHFGVGAVIGPLVIGWLPPGEYGLAFLGCAALSAFLLLTMKGVGERAARPPAEPDAAAPATPAVLLLAAFVLVYVLHVAIETGVGGWEPTHLQALGHTAAAAATATSVFWLMLTVGRFAVAPISLRWPPSVIVTWSCVAMAAFLGLATVPALAPYAYAGVGLAIAPIFPTGLAWLNRAVPSAAKAGAYVIAASMIGGVAFPPLLGGVIGWAGVSRLPLVLLLLAAICAGASWWLTGRTRGRGEGRAG